MLKPLLVVLLFSCLSCNFVTALVETKEYKTYRIEKTGLIRRYYFKLRSEHSSQYNFGSTRRIHSRPGYMAGNALNNDHFFWLHTQFLKSAFQLLYFLAVLAESLNH